MRFEAGRRTLTSTVVSNSEGAMSERATLAKAVIIVLFALIGWAICGAIMGIGPLFLSLQTTLIVHALGATLAFAALSAVYFSRFAFTTPLQTALIFLAIVVGLDVFLVAPVFVGDFGMFASPLGTWIPFALIFAATLLTGLAIARRGPHTHPA
jgi:hypothetical protein